MASEGDRYIASMRAILKPARYHVTWVPGETRRLGQILAVPHRGALPEDQVDDGTRAPYRLPIEERVDDAPDDAWQLVRSRGTKVSFKGEGEPKRGFSFVTSVSKAAARVEFKGKGSAVASFAGVRIHGVADRPAIVRRMVELFTRDKWDLDWAVVTKVAVCDAGTVLVAQERGAEIELEAKAGIKQIASLTTEFAGDHTSSKVYAVLNRAGMTPFFELTQVSQDARGLLTRGHAEMPMDVLPPELGGGGDGGGGVADLMAEPAPYEGSDPAE